MYDGVWMSSEDVLIHVDDRSVGIYSTVFAFSERDFPSDYGDGEYFRAKLEENRLTVFEKASIRPNLALSPAGPEGGVHTFVELPSQIAWAALLSALPGFWTFRFPHSGVLRSLSSGSAVDLLQLTSRRSVYRLRLLGAADSMQQKTWAIRYHRKRFNRILEEARQTPTAPALVKLTAEFAAHDNAIYSILDEMAATCSTMMSLIGRRACSSSFSDWAKDTRCAPEELRPCLSKLGWYDGFHKRRSGATHAFSAHVGAMPEGELTVFQIPQLRSPELPTPGILGNAQVLMEETSAGLDTFLQMLGQHMLKMFHPFDLARIRSAKALGETAEAFLVWARRITFSDALDPSARTVFIDAGTPLLDDDFG